MKFTRFFNKKSNRKIPRFSIDRKVDSFTLALGVYTTKKEINFTFYKSDDNIEIIEYEGCRYAIIANMVVDDKLEVWKNRINEYLNYTQSHLSGIYYFEGTTPTNCKIGILF